MIDALDSTLLGEVQEYFGLPNVSLVEKDFWVVQALAAIADVDAAGAHLVFGGGTALGRAHRLIRRMSEDIDLKIVSEGSLSRRELGQIRAETTARLHAAGFEFDADSEDYVVSRDSNRFTQFKLPYPSALGHREGLRAGIQIELRESPLRLPSVRLPVQSFIGEAQGKEPEIAAIPCVSVAQTAAEKFVALTRRIGQENRRGALRDDTLLRHVYDLKAIRMHYDHQDVLVMIPDVMKEDAKQFGRAYPEYANDPLRETLGVIELLSQDDSYAQSYQRFQQLMVYGEPVAFEDGLAVLREMSPPA